MAGRLVIAHHLIWTGYGHWLPNDPRGGGSNTVGDPHIAALGEPHFGRKKEQPPGRVVREFYEQAKGILKFPLLEFGLEEIEMIGEAFAAVMQQQRYTCYACAIMPDHVHMLIRKHKQQASEMIDTFQDGAWERLHATRRYDPDHPLWTTGGWKRFLFTPNEVRQVIGYIERNPDERGLPRQRWPFVKEYDGWPLHPGHNPNSPWARGLRDHQ
jgi:REP element-mobilizing transposase RayT